MGMMIAPTIVLMGGVTTDPRLSSINKTQSDRQTLAVFCFYVVILTELVYIKPLARSFYSLRLVFNRPVNSQKAVPFAGALHV